MRERYWYLVVTPEIAWLRNGDRVIGEVDPPDGYLFLPGHLCMYPGTSKEAIFTLLRTRLLAADCGEVSSER